MRRKGSENQSTGEGRGMRIALSKQGCEACIFSPQLLAGPGQKKGRIDFTVKQLLKSSGEMSNRNEMRGGYGCRLSR